MYLPFWLSREFVHNNCYVIDLAIAVSEKLFYLFFVCTEMDILDENTALVSIVFGVAYDTLSLFLLLLLKGFSIYFTLFIF